MLTNEILDILNSTAINRYLTPEEIQTLLHHNKLLDFSKDEIILKQGCQIPGTFLILKGEAFVTAKVLGEGITKQATLKSGDFIAPMNLFKQEPSSSTVISDTHMTCLLISHQYFAMLDFLSPTTKYKLSLAIAFGINMRIKNLYTKITNYMTETHMSERSSFGEVILSLTRPTVISLQDANIDLHWLHHANLSEIFSKTEFDILFSHASLIKAAKHCTLISEGEHGTACYFIIFGAVQSSIIKDNKVAKLSVIGPMHWVNGFISIEENVVSLFNYATCERAILLKISRGEIDFIQQNNLPLWYKLFNLFCKSFVDIEHAAEKLEIRLYSELYNR